MKNPVPVFALTVVALPFVTWLVLCAWAYITIPPDKDT